VVRGRKRVLEGENSKFSGKKKNNCIFVTDQDNEASRPEKDRAKRKMRSIGGRERGGSKKLLAGRKVESKREDDEGGKGKSPLALNKYAKRDSKLTRKTEGRGRWR